MTAFLNALSRMLVTLVALPAARTTTVTSAASDLSVYDGELAMILNSAAGTGTTPTLDGKIQHCDTSGGTYADSGITFTQITNADSLQSKLFQKSAVKQYIKFVGTIAGTTPSFTFGASLVGLKRSLS